MDTHRTTPAKARTVRYDCCADEQCTSGSRNNYFPGKRLTPDSFSVEQKYHVERRHLLNRAIHGWGLVYGFPVAMAAADPSCPGAELGTLEIGEGLALDKCGRELYQTGAVALKLEDIILLDQQGAPAQGNDQKARMAGVKAQASACWLLKVHYAEHSIGPVTLKDSCGDRKEQDHVCETVRYSLRRVDCNACCVEQGCELTCGCATGPCCEQHTNPDNEKLQLAYEQLTRAYEQLIQGASEEVAAKYRSDYEQAVRSLVAQGWVAPGQEQTHGRGGCRCLCDHLTGLQIGCECGSLCAVDMCVRTDLHNGVALACVKLGQDDCGNWRLASVYDACGPRRLVKRNDLLFDLIRGCDVTRISDISWAKWHRSETPVAWAEFRKALGPRDLTGRIDAVTSFTVTFSGPVQAKTVRVDCFAMTMEAFEFGEGWGNLLRAPITGVSHVVNANDPPGFVRGATLLVDARWLSDAVGNVVDVGRRKTLFERGQIKVEIEIRGDFIVDCKGQTVDANAIGLLPCPTGNGTPGGTFLSTFIVDSRPPDAKLTAQEQPVEGVKS